MRPFRRSAIAVLVIDSITREEVPELCGKLRVLLQGSQPCAVACDVGALAADLVAIEALAGLQLAARQLGFRIGLLHASSELETLVDFCGLGDVLTCEVPPGASGHPKRAGRDR